MKGPAGMSLAHVRKGTKIQRSAVSQGTRTVLGELREKAWTQLPGFRLRSQSGPTRELEGTEVARQALTWPSPSFNKKAVGRQKKMDCGERS